MRDLQIDHKEYDGGAHRKRCGGYTAQYYQEILDYVLMHGVDNDKYQLLCNACHETKHEALLNKQR